MEDKIHGSMQTWKKSIKVIEECDSKRSKPLRPREVHWIAYKSVLTDLQYRGLITREELNRRRTKILNIVASFRSSTASIRRWTLELRNA